MEGGKGREGWREGGREGGRKGGEREEREWEGRRKREGGRMYNNKIHSHTYPKYVNIGNIHMYNECKEGRGRDGEREGEREGEKEGKREGEREGEGKGRK